MVGTSDFFAGTLTAATGQLAALTLLGGSGPSENAAAIALDGLGNLAVLGSTDSTDFPTTADAVSRVKSGGANFTDAVLAVLNPSATTLTYGTYLGGTSYETGLDVAVRVNPLDSSNSIVVSGDTFSNNFPQVDPLQSRSAGNEAFVARFIRSGPGLTMDFASYLGGNGEDSGAAIAVERSTGDIVVAGNTASTNFPTVNGPDSTLNGVLDGFVTRIVPPPPTATVQWSDVSVDVPEGTRSGTGPNGGVTLTVTRTDGSLAGTVRVHTTPRD